MNIYVFEDIEQVSSNWHTNGGLVIIADSIDHAKEVIVENIWIKPTAEEWDSVSSFALSKREEPRYWIMPNAGCC